MHQLQNHQILTINSDACQGQIQGGGGGGGVP